MWSCPKCGTEGIAASLDFCPHCGEEKVGSVPEVEAKADAEGTAPETSDDPQQRM
jgi:predicted RNA-binding Zn-ribbon protein involved in translation (DUF1610 family)